MPPTPMPCTTRLTISHATLGVKPASSEPATKMTRRQLHQHLRLKRSASLPQSGTVAVMASRSAVTTQV